MAGVIFTVATGPTGNLTASNTQTLLQVKAPTNQRVLLREVRITGSQPIGGTDTPVLFKLTRSTASFGTGTSVTPQKNNPSDSETIQSTSAKMFSGEPTSTDTFFPWSINPESGLVELFPDNRPIVIPGGQSVQLVAITPSGSTPNLNVQFRCEE